MSTSKPKFTQIKRDYIRDLQTLMLVSQMGVIILKNGEPLHIFDESSTAAYQAIFLADLVRQVRLSKVTKHILGDSIQTAYASGVLDQAGRIKGMWMKNELACLLKIDVESFRDHFPEHSFHPDISAGLEAITELQKGAMQIPGADLSKVVALAVLRASRKPEYAAARRRHTRARSKRVREVKDYVAALFAQRSRLLAVRVDLGYSKEPSFTGGMTEVSFDQVGADREALIRELHKMPDNKFMGYVLRVEWGPKKGYHLHMLALLDGHKAHDRTGIAREIGTAWTNVTKGKGTHWEPKELKGEERGTDMIHRKVPTERAALLHAARYLCKAGHYIEFYRGKGVRTFFHGRTPTTKSEARDPAFKAAD